MEVILQPFATAPDLPGHALAVTTVTQAGEPLFLFVEARAAAEVRAMDEEPGWARFPRSRMVAARRASLAIGAGAGQRRVAFESDAAFPLVDLLPDGGFVVCATRCRLTQAGPELNAAVYRADGSLATRHCFGDGIEDLAVDARGRVWVSYFDEGVFGNFGWGVGRGPDPVGAAGLVCFDRTGAKLWEFDLCGPEGDRLSIADVYGLNVQDDRASIYYYTDFMLVRIGEDFTGTAHRTDRKGCHAFALAGDRVLFSGGYGDPPELGYLGRQSADGQVLTRPAAFRKTDGAPFAEGRFLGRGPLLFRIEGEAIWAADLRAQPERGRQG